MFRLKFGFKNSAARRRQSVGAREATRAGVNWSVRSPDCMGL
jgi:hypothetical protein